MALKKCVLVCGSLCVGALLSVWGCGAKTPPDADLRKDFAGKPGKKFDPNELPPNLRAGMEKFLQSHNQPPSAKANAPTGTQ